MSEIQRPDLRNLVVEIKLGRSQARKKICDWVREQGLAIGDNVEKETHCLLKVWDNKPQNCVKIEFWKAKNGLIEHKFS